MSLQIEPLGLQHDRAAFSCGVTALDSYMRERAGQDARRSVTVCYVLCETQSSTVMGYYTLSATSVHLNDLPSAIAKGLPRYPDVPAALLGRLAVDQRFQGSGMGELLLLDALRRVTSTATQLGIVGVVVDAENESVVAFYERYEFQRLGTGSLRLLLTLSKIRGVFPGI